MVDMTIAQNFANKQRIRNVLDKTQVSNLEILDNIEGEQETCGNLYEYDGDGDMDMDPSGSAEIDEVLANIREASKGVKECMDAAYRGVMNQFNEFLIQESVIQPGGDIFSQQMLSSNMDYYIVGFIMSKCDDTDMCNTNKGPRDVQRSYSHAQKLCAGLTYGFRKSGRGKDHWNEHMASGNPSISDLVSSYMLSLHKRKVAKGEAPTSAHAISPDILKRLYEYNRQPGNWDNTQISSGNWC
ncbi:hypothetical protein IW262DRAFT_1298095 [Armillaria fumosa]|nr:hypothetical protein IW262DRAFT_1298095 [Armillaria fumosa]